jgi:hypothetical protein
MPESKRGMRFRTPRREESLPAHLYFLRTVKGLFSTTGGKYCR